VCPVARIVEPYGFEYAPRFSEWAHASGSKTNLEVKAFGPDLTLGHRQGRQGPPGAAAYRRAGPPTQILTLARPGRQDTSAHQRNDLSHEKRCEPW
jgi:hypothetical protein